MKQLLIVFLYILSCSLPCSAQITTESDSIPMTINAQNTMPVKVVLNETDTLNLNFDTGTTEVNLTNKALRTKLKFSPKLYSTLYNLKIGGNIYKTKVYDAELAGHGADGNFGWDLFKDKIVELNYDLNLMIIHQTLPKKVAKDSKFTKLKMEF